MSDKYYRNKDGLAGCFALFIVVNLVVTILFVFYLIVNLGG